MLKWDVCENVYGIRLKSFRVKQRRKREKSQPPHFDCKLVWVSRRVAADRKIVSFSVRARVGRKCVLASVRAHEMAMAAPTRLRGRRRLTGMNWLKMLFTRVMVIGKSLSVFRGRWPWGIIVIH